MEVEVSFENKILARDYKTHEMIAIAAKGMDMISKEIEKMPGWNPSVSPNVSIKYIGSSSEDTSMFHFYVADDAAISFKYVREINRNVSTWDRKFLAKLLKHLDVTPDAVFTIYITNGSWKEYSVADL